MDYENNIDFDKLLKELVDNFYKAMAPLADALKNIIDQLQVAFLKSLEQVKFSMTFLDKKITKKNLLNF